jgi:ubiquinol-cytochrome c reductase cytochrome b subunit
MKLRQNYDYNQTTNNILKYDSWNEWFAGIVDGDGYFYINKKNEISFEITTSIIDIRILYNIQNKLNGGSIQIRSGSASVRYRVKQKQIILQIIHRLNGHLYTFKRLQQFEKCCKLLNLEFIPSLLNLDVNNKYLSGLIDSDGTISISVSKTNSKNSQLSGLAGKIKRLEQSRGNNQLYLKITSISEENLLIIKNSYYLGKIYIEKANKKNKVPNKKYHWTINSYEEFVYLYEYLKKNSLKSVKMHRIRLIYHYFHYKKLKYHLKEPTSVEYKIWSKFCKTWFKYSF